MKITYDDDVDAAYIQLVSEIAPGGVGTTIAYIDTPSKKSQIALEFDAKGFLLGIEVLFASDCLLPEVLAAAEPP